jgi:hypothetical protein
MSDDLDDLLRGAMKTLDDQVPSGYFDALPNKTLARLEGKDMQSTTGTTNEREPEAVPPPAVKEDSGLHDIRSLAQSTKQRMANKRVSTSPVRSDDDLLAASSAGWVAMPEPAKMVSLPALDELPSKKDMRAEMKASKAASVATAEAVPASASASIERPAFGANLTARKKSSKAPVAIAGVVLAAAAGVGIYVFTQNQSKDSAPAIAKAETATQGVAQNAAPAPVVAAPTPPPAPPPPPTQPEATDTAAAAAGSAAAVETPPPVEVAKPEPTPPKGKHSTTPTKTSKPVGKKAGSEETSKVETKAPPPEEKPKDVKTKGGGKDENEPSFDALLKEAGVDQTKKPAAPKLDKKELSRSDFNAGMGGVKNAAQGCYKGTQGTVQFKMVIAPSGSVSSVSVTGAFAGKPEASCVESAVRGAHFPAWDGSPQTFTYSYLLAD